MSPEWVSILALVALFVVGTLLPINMGALAFVAAWLVGMFSMDFTEQEIIAGISGDLILTLVGVTYLFAIAKNNGTVDLIVRASLRGVGGRVWLIPWVMFFLTALLTAIGAASPAACAIVGPIALGFAGRYQINPLLMGMFVVHGAQGGGFSPISIYGTITNSVIERNGLPADEMTIFLASLLFNLGIAALLFALLGGRQLMTRRVGTTSDTSPDCPEDEPAGGIRADQVVTLAVFVVVVLLALALDRNIGFTAITAAVLLTALFPKKQKGAVQQVAWSTVLLVAGVTTYATILEEAGTPEFVGTWAAGLGAATLGALVLLYVGGVISAFASSVALLPIIIPIAIPLVDAGGISPIALVAGLAVASTIVDVSPFSTNGALMVANRPDTITEERFYHQVLAYSALVVVIGPAVVWALMILPSQV